MSPIFDETAVDFCRELDLIASEEDVTVLLNSPGGSVFAGWTIIGRMLERIGDVNAKVYGHAASMSMYFLLYCDYVEALEVTRFLIHRADGYIKDEDDQKFLDGINKDLRKHMESKLDIDALKDITGLTMDDIFKSEKVKDVWLTAKEAKKIGLINKVNRMAPEELKAFNERFVAFNRPQGSDPTQGSEKVQPENNNTNSQTKKTMTKAELKAQNPEIYAEILAEGRTEGIKAEQTRVKSWLPYLDIDKENVIASIKDGKEFTPDINSEMIVKMQSAKTVKAIEADSPEAIATAQAKEKTEKETELAAFKAEVEKGVKNIKLV